MTVVEVRGRRSPSKTGWSFGIVLVGGTAYVHARRKTKMTARNLN